MFPYTTSITLKDTSRITKCIKNAEEDSCRITNYNDSTKRILLNIVSWHLLVMNPLINTTSVKKF